METNLDWSDLKNVEWCNWMDTGFKKKLVELLDRTSVTETEYAEAKEWQKNKDGYVANMICALKWGHCIQSF